MLKRFCDICGAEIENASYSIGVCHDYGRRRLRRYDDVCGECAEAFKAWTKARKQTPEPKTLEVKQYYLR